MADYVITPANVVPTTVDGVNPVLTRRLAGEAITAGQTVAIDAVSGEFILASSNTVGLESAAGIALNDGAVGQPVDIIQDGYVTLGAGIAADVAILANAAGGLAPSADLLAADTLSILGYFTADGLLRVKVCNTGAVKA